MKFLIIFIVFSPFSLAADYNPVGGCINCSPVTKSSETMFSTGLLPKLSFEDTSAEDESSAHKSRLNLLSNLNSYNIEEFDIFEILGLKDTSISDQILLFEEALEKSLSFHADKKDSELLMDSSLKRLISLIEKEKSIGSKRLKELIAFANLVVSTDDHRKIKESMTNLFSNTSFVEINLNIAEAMSDIDNDVATEYLKTAIGGEVTFDNVLGIIDVAQSTYTSPEKSLFQEKILSLIGDNVNSLEKVRNRNGDNLLCFHTRSLFRYSEESENGLYIPLSTSKAYGLDNELPDDKIQLILLLSRLGFSMDTMCSDGRDSKYHMMKLYNEGKLTDLSTEEKVTLGLDQDSCYRLSRLNLNDVCNVAKVIGFMEDSLVDNEKKSLAKPSSEITHIDIGPSNTCSVILFDKIMTGVNKDISDRELSVTIKDKHYEKVNLDTFLRELKKLSK